ELEKELVPEWKAKYLDYKGGKKKIKLILRAIQRATRSPRTPRTPFIQHPDPAAKPPDPNDPQSTRRAEISTPKPQAEQQPLRRRGSRSSDHATYGSTYDSPKLGGRSERRSFELPDPALDPTPQYVPPYEAPAPAKAETSPAQRSQQPAMQSPSAGNLTTSVQRGTQLILRVISQTEGSSRGRKTPAESALEVERRHDEFFAFLDGELEKINSFYEAKEREATARLEVLSAQLHFMVHRRRQQVLAAKKSMEEISHDTQRQPKGFGGLSGAGLRNATRALASETWSKTRTLAGRTQFGKNSEAMATQGASPEVDATTRQYLAQRDYAPREDTPNNDVSYRTAKRKLKHALQEFYRGMELLKAYAYLNQTAFRKINKKYDKAVNPPVPMQYMTERVNRASFVQSEVLETLIDTVEDLYARYFERGNHKIAASKLRHSVKKRNDFSPSTFRAGLWLMAGTLLSAQALVRASRHLLSGDSIRKVQTSYLLQIYGGYFLITFHLLLFCIACMIWTKSRINHAFVFEYEPKHILEWRQLLEFPSFFIFLMGLFMWLNFSWINVMYIYWPVVLVGLTVIIVFLPARVLYHKSRKWWAITNWRLLTAGALYKVEFRDFFLGDMYCSQVYSMGNIELFFCLYASHWQNPVKCNSSHSRLLGFLTCVPAIWRMFQCIFRYITSKQAFPHFANLVKYMFSVLYYASLSMYRIDKRTRFQAPFITFALLNAVYTSVWDVGMDWSLGTPQYKLLREELVWRRNPWVYYIAIVVNIVIRFNWIFYAIFSNDIQHSAVLSFAVSLSEVVRRGVWAVFRVENEHSSNVRRFRASRDIPLPYDLSTILPAAGQNVPEAGDYQLQEQVPTTPFMAPGDVEHGDVDAAARRAREGRSRISRVGTMVASAHTQDFERRRLPSYMSSATVDQDHDRSLEDTTDEEYGFTTDDDSADETNGQGNRRSPMHRIAE
ncbi:uncharacterized protein N7482_002768, partial [Penicillium canariense]